MLNAIIILNQNRYTIIAGRLNKKEQNYDIILTTKRRKYSRQAMYVLIIQKTAELALLRLYQLYTAIVLTLQNIALKSCNFNSKDG